MKILIVDGEPGAAAGLAGWLVENGWPAPGVAVTSDEAVEWINQNGRVDLLVSEVFLQPADGFTLRESVLPHLPKMKTIFLSASDVSEHAGRMQGCPFLPKPVTGEVLDDTIRLLFEPKPAVVSARPVPAAVTPRAVPMATPRPVAATAVPSATAAPKAAVAVAPRPVIASAAGPRPMARPTARPVVAPAAPVARVAAATPVYPVAKMPVAVPAAPVARVSAAAPVAKVGAGGEIELPPDDLVGSTIGNYRVEAKIGAGSQGGIYRATQTNMDRPVRFYTLDRERASNPAEIQQFIANASVKANVAHPNIFAVYEAGAGSGVYFYSCEYAPCRSLAQLRETGQFLDENTALQTMKVVCEVMAYFAKENITHNLITDNAILIGQHNRPRVANIAAYQAAVEFDQAAEMTRLGEIIASVLPEDSQALGIRNLALTLASGNTATYPTWTALARAVESLEPKVAPEDAYKLDAQERAAIRMVEEAKKRQKKNMIINTAISLFLLSTALFSVWWFLLRQKAASVREFNGTVEVPAGEFIYQDGQKLSLPAFNIDEFEVTIGQYAEFLKYLADHPNEAAKFDHPKQPKGKTHVPTDWADMDLKPPMLGYYTRAKDWGKFKDAPLDVNCPVFGVDWYDAYAYASWKGRRLPTEQEWEKAARGTGGFRFPWGDEDDPKRADLGGDFDPNPVKGGEIDGYDRWAPVDAMKKDKSPFGAMGMAGNVSEWTETYDVDPKLTSNKIPVIRGGNFKTRSPEDYSLTKRILLITELESGEALGFRTVSDGPPAGKSK